MIDPDELDADFRHHPPTNKEREQSHGLVRTYCLVLARQLNELVPDGMEKNQAIKVNLSQVMFWANAGVARQDGISTP